MEKEYMAEISFYGRWDEQLVAKVTHFAPPRPAPACSNPDSPAYSDPGDGGEIEYDLFARVEDFNGIAFDIPLPEDFYIDGPIEDEIFIEMVNRRESYNLDLREIWYDRAVEDGR